MNVNFDYTRTGLRFTYLNIAQECKQKYSAEGWFVRKVVALPKAAWSASVKTIYHLGKAILVGMIARAGDRHYIKAQCFCIARDLQESYGWWNTVFTDEDGQHNVAESRLHKLYYNRVLSAQSPIADKPYVINEMKIDSSNFQKLSYDLKTDTDVILAALDGCKTQEDAIRRFGYFGDFAQTDKYFQQIERKAILALVKKYPALFGFLPDSVQNDETVVSAALDGCSNVEDARQIFHHIRSSVQESLKAKFQEKYPDLLLEWSEPEDLKNNNSPEATSARMVLQNNFLLETKPTEERISQREARGMLCKLLKQNQNITDQELKKAYHKTVLLLHPDKATLKSSAQACRILTVAYQQAALKTS